MLEQLLSHYGLVAVFLGAGIEGETCAILGGLLAHRGLFTPLQTAAAATAGSFCADQLLFQFGRWLRGSARVQRWRRRPGFARALATFERHPTGFIFAFRFLYGARTISPVMLGTTGIATARFMVVNAVAALVWGCLFSALGYLGGSAIETLFGRVARLERILIPAAAILVLIGAAVAIIHRRRHARSSPADRA